MQQRHFVRVFRFQQIHDVFQRARFHIHDVLERIDEAHFEIHRNIFVQVARSVVVFRAEHGRDFKHPFVNAHKRLLVQLRRLCQIHLLSEVIQFENVRAALGARKIDLRRVHLGKILQR